ncbi:MAG: rhodanese-like domain-containing protein, partial [Dolichospermum sp.]
MLKNSYLKNLKKPKLFALVTVFFAFVVSIPLLPFPVLSATSAAKIQFVSDNWVTENAKDSNLRILDVRNFPLDYIEGHLPNAVNIADTAFRGPKEGLPVQYWKKEKLGEIFA